MTRRKITTSLIKKLSVARIRLLIVSRLAERPFFVLLALPWQLTDAEVLVPHGVEPDDAVAHLALQLLEAQVRPELHVALHGQVRCQVLEIGQDRFGFSSTNILNFCSRC